MNIITYHYLSNIYPKSKKKHESIHIPISCYGWLDMLDPLKPLMTWTSEFPGFFFFSDRRSCYQVIPQVFLCFSGELLMYTPCSS